MIEIMIKDGLLPYQKIANHLKLHGQKASWIAGHIHCSKEHIANCLNGSFTLTEKNRQKINALLGTDY